MTDFRRLTKEEMGIVHHGPYRPLNDADFWTVVNALEAAYSEIDRLNTKECCMTDYEFKQLEAANKRKDELIQEAIPLIEQSECLTMEENNEGLVWIERARKEVETKTPEQSAQGNKSEG